MTPRLFSKLAVALILLPTVFVYRDMFGMWFTDVDVFPLISTGRIGSLTDLIDILTAPLMQGLMSNALFYRPLSSISWGIDEAIWGLNPLGYHLTDLTIHLANSLLLFLLVRDTTNAKLDRSTQTTASVSLHDFAAFAVALLFAIHPIAQEVVPAIARRADLLYALFLLLMVRSLSKAILSQDNVRRHIAFATLFCVLGFASKDAALALPAIAVAFVFCFANSQTLRDRVYLCIRTCWPMALAALVFLVGRTIVLGGIGGYAPGELWAHQAPADVVASSLRPFACAIVLPGNLDTCAYISRVLLRIVVVLVIVSLALVCWRAARNNKLFPPLGILFFALLSLAGIAILHIISGTPIFARTLYVGLLFISIAVGWGFFLLPQAIAGHSNWLNISIPERAIHAAASIVFLVAASSVLYGAWRGQYIDEWHSGVEGAEAAKVAMTDIARSLESVADNSVVYLINVPFKETRLKYHPMRERPMFLEHTIQGFVDLAYPDKNLEVIVLTYLQINDSPPEDVASIVSYQSNPAAVDVQTDSNGIATRFIWWVSYPRISPWRDNKAERDLEANRIRIILNPDVPVEDQAVFLIYQGNRVVRRDPTQWTLNYTPTAL